MASGSIPRRPRSNLAAGGSYVCQPHLRLRTVLWIHVRQLRPTYPRYSCSILEVCNEEAADGVGDRGLARGWQCGDGAGQCFGGRSGDAISPWDATEQINDYVIDLAPLTTSWGTQFGVAPLIKSSLTSAAYNSSLISAQAASVGVLLDQEFAADSYLWWDEAGYGVNAGANFRRPRLLIPAIRPVPSSGRCSPSMPRPMKRRATPASLAPSPVTARATQAPVRQARRGCDEREFRRSERCPIRPGAD